MKNEKPIIKGVIIDPDRDFYFGHCLYDDHKNYCGCFEESERYCIDKIGKEPIIKHSSSDVWYYCPICKIKWCIGNVFSAPFIDRLEVEDFDDFTGKEEVGVKQ